MRYSKWLVWLAMAAGAALPGASTLAAQDRYDRDLVHDYRNVQRIRTDMAHDQYRLNEAIRCGRYGEAAAIRRDMERDQWRLNAQRRDIRNDHRNDYRYGWR
jgi:hypothetical protein